MSLAVVNDRGKVVLIGGAVASALSRSLPASKLPSATTGQSRLFDEIFGKEGGVQPAKLGQKTGLAAKKSKADSDSALTVLEMPAHTLSPARLLWRTMMASFAITPSTQPSLSGDFAKKEGSTAAALGGPGTTKSDQSAVVVVYSPSPDSLADTFKLMLSLGAKH